MNISHAIKNNEGKHKKNEDQSGGMRPYDSRQDFIFLFTRSVDSFMCYSQVQMAFEFSIELQVDAKFSKAA